MRQLLVEHQHFNDPEKREHIRRLLLRAASQQTIPIVNYNDPVSDEENRKMELAALRESGQVEQDADVIIMLEQPDENNPNARTIRVEKNKDGEVCQLDISFWGNIQRFGIVDNYHYEQSEIPLPPALEADFEEIGI